MTLPDSTLPWARADPFSIARRCPRQAELSAIRLAVWPCAPSFAVFHFRSDSISFGRGGLMATEKQLDFFKTAWDEEVAREKQIRESAKTYLTLITAYSAFLIFVLGAGNHPATMTLKLVFSGAVCSLAAGFALCVAVTQASDYEELFETAKMAKELVEKNAMSDDEFFDRRIADYVIAMEENEPVTSRKATQVQAAGFALLGGIALHAAYFLIAT